MLENKNNSQDLWPDNQKEPENVFLHLMSSVLFGLNYGRKVMFSSPSVVTFKYYVLAYSES